MHAHTHTCMFTHIHTHSYAWGLPQIPRRINTPDLHTQTHTFNLRLTPLPTPTWINSPAAPENATAMMSPAIPLLQRHKRTPVPSAQRANVPSHFLRFPLCLNDNSPAETLMRAHTLPLGIVGFWTTGAYCAPALQYFLIPYCNMKEAARVQTHAHICVICVCASRRLCALRNVKAASCPPSKGSHKISSQAGYDMMRQGDNKTTTLVHG